MKRTLEIKVRLTKAELDTVTQKTRKAGLSREGFARAAMLGLVVKEAPSADTRQLLWELRHGGGNLNQALRKLNTMGLADIPMLKKASEEMYKAAKALTDTYAKPDV